MPRRGRPGKEEIELIKKLHSEENMTPADIAKRLDRTIDGIVSILSTKSEAVEQIDELSHKLENSPEWALFKSEFKDDELKYFKFRYGKLMNQFKNDIYATEETQIFQFIKFEILMNRNLIGAKRAVHDIERLESIIDNIYGKYKDFNKATDTDKAIVALTESQLLTAKAAKQAQTSEFVKLQDKQSDIMKSLKATRDQRFKDMKDQETTFLGIIKSFTSEKWRIKEGRQLSMAHAAGLKAEKELGKTHKYLDGQYDKPILSAQSVNEDS